MENKANSLGKLAAAAMGIGLLLAAAPVGLKAFGQAPAGRDGVANRLISPGRIPRSRGWLTREGTSCGSVARDRAAQPW